MDNKRVKVWVPGDTTFTNLRRFAGRTLRQVGNRQVTMVDNQTNGKARIQHLETKAVEIVEEIRSMPLDDIVHFPMDALLWNELKQTFSTCDQTNENFAV